MGCRHRVVRAGDVSPETPFASFADRHAAENNRHREWSELLVFPAGCLVAMGSRWGLVRWDEEAVRALNPLTARHARKA